MIRNAIFGMALTLASLTVNATNAGQTVKQIYYCGADFAMLMSGGDWYLVQKSLVGEQKLNHFLSMAMFMMASGKKTANVFPGEGVSWCGNPNMKPITIFSIAE